MTSLANDGEWLAFTELGNILEQGGGGVEKNIEAALFWYRRAIVEADDANAHLALARISYNSGDSNKDYSEAFQHCEKALSAPPPFDLTTANKIGALLMLAQIHQEGLSVPTNLDSARNCYEKAAEFGSVVAMRLLGHLEWKSGKFLRGLLLILRAVYRGTRIALASPNDPKLVGIEAFTLGSSARIAMTRAQQSRGKNAPLGEKLE